MNILGASMGRSLLRAPLTRGMNWTRYSTSTKMCIKSFSIIMIDASFPMLYHKRCHICIKLPGCYFMSRINVGACGSSPPLYLFLAPKCSATMRVDNLVASTAKYSLVDYLRVLLFLVPFCEKARIYHGGPKVGTLLLLLAFECHVSLSTS